MHSCELKHTAISEDLTLSSTALYIFVDTASGSADISFTVLHTLLAFTIVILLVPRGEMHRCEEISTEQSMG